MPTVFDRLSGALDGNTVTASVTVQAGALEKVTGAVVGLIEHPPKNIGDLGSAIQALPLKAPPPFQHRGAAQTQARCDCPRTQPLSGKFDNVDARQHPLFSFSGRAQPLQFPALDFRQLDFYGMSLHVPNSII